MNYWLSKLRLSEEKPVTEFEDPCGDPVKFKQAVDEAVKQLEDDRKWIELRKGYPKEIFTSSPSAQLYGSVLYLGDWIIQSGVVFEVLEVQHFHIRRYPDGDPYDKGPGYSSDYGVKLKVKTVSFSKTSSVEGWKTFPNQNYNPDNVLVQVINRNLQEPKLD